MRQASLLILTTRSRKCIEPFFLASNTPDETEAGLSFFAQLVFETICGEHLSVLYDLYLMQSVLQMFQKRRDHKSSTAAAAI